MKTFLQLLNGTKELQKKVLGELETFVTDIIARTPSSGGGDTGEILSATVNLSAAQLQNLGTTPIQVIAAPGVDASLVPLRYALKYNRGTTDFDGNIRLEIGGSAQQQNLSSFTTSGIYQNDFGLFNSTENAALEITTSSEPTQGDGSIDITVFYTTANF